MAFIDSSGHICRKTTAGGGRVGNLTSTRNWWLIKQHGLLGHIHIKNITFPKKFVGKRVRFKIEIIEDKEMI